MTRIRATAVLAASIFLVHCSSETLPLQPIDWQRTPGGGPNGSVLGFGPPGTFGEAGNFTISAFKDTDGVYKLYYGGADTATINPACTGINGGHWRIGPAPFHTALTRTRA